MNLILLILLVVIVLHKHEVLFFINYQKFSVSCISKYCPSSQFLSSVLLEFQ